jgi:demethylphylloquinol methyltransferase
MSTIRTGRRKYYDIFPRFYDAFITLHSRRNRDGTRNFIAEAANIPANNHSVVLDICCGTGSVALTLKRKHPASLVVGLDFSRGMLVRARRKASSGPVSFVEADASNLPFGHL